MVVIVAVIFFSLLVGIIMLKINYILVLKTSYEHGSNQGMGRTVCPIPNNKFKATIADSFSGISANERHNLVTKQAAKEAGFNPSKLRLVGQHYSGYFYA